MLTAILLCLQIVQAVFYWNWGLAVSASGCDASRGFGPAGVNPLVPALQWGRVSCLTARGCTAQRRCEAGAFWPAGTGQHFLGTASRTNAFLIAAQGRGAVTVPGGVKEMCRCGTEGYGWWVWWGWVMVGLNDPSGLFQP